MGEEALCSVTLREEGTETGRALNGVEGMIGGMNGLSEKTVEGGEGEWSIGARAGRPPSFDRASRSEGRRGYQSSNQLRAVALWTVEG